MADEELNSDSSGDEEIEEMETKETEENNDDDADNDDDDDEVEDSTSTTGNPGWADAMARVLGTNKPKRSKSIVLSKAKKLSKTVKDENEESEDKKVDLETLNARRKEKQIHGILRVKPSVLEQEREKRLKRIATKGMVQLFNEVRKHQKALEPELEVAGASKRKREKVFKKVDKKALLDLMMGKVKSEPLNISVKSEEEDDAVKSEPEDVPTWEVLRDDFMMGAPRLKDWDKDDNVT